MLTQEKCIKTLKGEASIPARIIEVEKTKMTGKVMSAFILCIKNKVLREMVREKFKALM